MQVWVHDSGFRVLGTLLRCLRASGLCMGQSCIKVPSSFEVARVEAGSGMHAPCGLALTKPYPLWGRSCRPWPESLTLRLLA